MCNDLTFCQFFFKSETRKLIPRKELGKGSADRSICRTEHDIGENLILRHLDMSDRDTKAEDLFKLELDGGAHLDEFVRQIFRMRDRCGELAS